jgi:hypothetical protein
LEPAAVHNRSFAILALLPVALAAQAADTAPRYLSVINRAHDSITTVEVAVAGSEAFQSRPIDTIAGGGGSTTMRLGNAGCRFDLRLQFRNGRTADYRDVNACKGDVLVVAPLR